MSMHSEMMSQAGVPQLLATNSDEVRFLPRNSNPVTVQALVGHEWTEEVHRQDGPSLKVFRRFISVPDTIEQEVLHTAEIEVSGVKYAVKTIDARAGYLTRCTCERTQRGESVRSGK